MPESVGRGERRRTTPERRRRVSPWASIAVFLAAGVAARVRASAPAPVVVLLWPEEAHSFRNGTGIIAALVTKNFDPPREGSIELLLFPDERHMMKGLEARLKLETELTRFLEAELAADPAPADDDEPMVE